MMEFKPVGEIDFGQRDARHASIHSEFDEALFSKIFIEPSTLQTKDFFSGKKSFVYGIKGSGKSAFLRYLEISKRKKSFTRFVYFSDNLREINQSKPTDVGIDLNEANVGAVSDEYWRTFFFLLIAKTIYEEAPHSAKKYLEFVRRQSTSAPGSFFERLFGAAPTISSWAASLGPQSNMKLSGEFSDIVNVAHFYQNAIQLLAYSKLSKELWLFVDELEVVFESEEQFQRDVKIASSLVRVIRDLNEEFRKKDIPIYISCAIRKEISERILGGDAAKIVSDLGEEITWQRTSKSYDDSEFIHPLFEIALRRIFYSNSPGKPFFSAEDKKRTKQKYFPFFTNRPGMPVRSAQYLLDLTTYRPRDIAILFNEAKKIDRTQSHFRADTFSRLIRKPLREAFWTDFTEALRAQFSQQQIDLFKKVFFRLDRRFNFNDFMLAVDDFSADPTIAELLDRYSAKDWANVMKELYTLGAVGNAEKGETIDERLMFHFRGYGDGLIIKEGVEIVKQRAMFDA